MEQWQYCRVKDTTGFASSAESERVRRAWGTWPPCLVCCKNRASGRRLLAPRLGSEWWQEEQSKKVLQFAFKLAYIAQRLKSLKASKLASKRNRPESARDKGRTKAKKTGQMQMACQQCEEADILYDLEHQVRCCMKFICSECSKEHYWVPRRAT